MEIAIIAARGLLALTFAVAGLAKLADLPGSRKSMVDFGVPKALAPTFGLLLPIAELLIALALLPKALAWYGGIAALAMLVIFIVGIIVTLARGRTPDCHCFGKLHSAPIGFPTIARNVVFCAFATVIVKHGPDQPGMLDWTQGFSGTQLGLILGGSALALLLILNFWMMLQILKQNGRTLLRIEALESKAGIVAPAAPPPGLPQGSQAPEFEYEHQTLKTLLASGNPALLLFTGPDCQPCKELQPEIADWQTKHAEKLTIEVITEGGKTRPIAESYQCHGTPGAVLINPDGAVGSALAMGADPIRELVASATRPKPPGPGEDAPQVELPDLDGNTIELKSFRGKPAVLLFWNPSCGYCQNMLDRIKNREDNGSRLLVISTGSVEANRAQGFRASVVLDTGFSTGNAFGATGTPSAIKINAEGKVSSLVAVGADEVMKLLF